LSTSFVCVTPTPRLTLFPYTTLFRSLRLDVVLQRPGTDGEEARGNDLLAPLLVRRSGQQVAGDLLDDEAVEGLCAVEGADDVIRSEEHTSELQSPCNLAWSPCNLVCRLLLEKKNESPHGFLVTFGQPPSFPSLLLHVLLSTVSQGLTLAIASGVRFVHSVTFAFPA